MGGEGTMSNKNIKEQDLEIQNEITDLDVAKKLVHISQSAQSRDIEFNLTFSKTKRLLNTKKCFFTGVPLQLKYHTAPDYLSFDRLDPNKGYTDDNVVACTTQFNKLKANLTPEHIKLIYNKLKKRKLL